MAVPKYGTVTPTSDCDSANVFAGAELAEHRNSTTVCSVSKRSNHRHARKAMVMWHLQQVFVTPARDDQHVAFFMESTILRR